MKPFLVMVAVFVLSMPAIVAGYSPLSHLLAGTYWNLVSDDLPLLSVSAANSVSTLAILGTAFWLSRQSRATYEAAVFGYSFIAPFLLVMGLLPGAESMPSWATANQSTTIGFFVVIQMTATYLLRDWFWETGQPRHRA